MIPAFSLRRLLATVGVLGALFALFRAEPTGLSGLLVLVLACALHVVVVVGLLVQGASRFFWSAAFIPTVIASETALDSACFQRIDFFNDGVVYSRSDAV